MAKIINNKKNIRKKERRKRFKSVSISKLTRFSFLPSVFTIFNLFLGYMAVLQIIKNNFITACYLITLSVIMDGFDGTIARITKTESNFGMQLDSLVDAITFGFVPAVFIYIWGFQSVHPHNGKILGFIFLSAGIIRLARFNVLKEADAFPANIFIGLPIPVGAISILSVVLVLKDPIQEQSHLILFSLYIILIAFLMISNIKYRTLKKINSKHNLLVLFIVAILVALAIMYPSYTIPIFTFIYIISPILFYISKKLKKNRAKSKVKKSSDKLDKSTESL
jgi:CDP-diacylglycerol--serine O-phosphatidyltransferase